MVDIKIDVPGLGVNSKRLAVVAPPAPMQLGSPETGDFRGYEVDLLNEVGRRAGFGLSFRRALWSVIIRELVTGEIDMVCGAASITS